MTANGKGKSGPRQRKGAPRSSKEKHKPNPSPRHQQQPITTTDDNDDNDEHDGERTSAWASASRNMAIWRMVFFSIMTFYELGNSQVLTPFGELDITLDEHNPGKDRWFAYNQFTWIQDLHAQLGKDPLRADRLQQVGFLCGVIAAFGKELKIPFWRLSTNIFTLLYLIRFLAKATNFTNHNYLYPLLMFLTMLSGGGNLSGKIKSDAELRICEACIVTMRAQFVVLYGFASLWKLHGDWMAGRIVADIFLSFEERDQAAGVPWSWMQEQFPHIFMLLALAGFALDLSMFIVLAIFRPKPAYTRLFLTFTLLFHVFTTITMGQVIGYSFPATCVAGLALYLPFRRKRTFITKHIISYDQSSVDWIGIYSGSLVHQLFYSNSSENEPIVVRINDENHQKNKDKVKRPPHLLPPSWLNFFVIAFVSWQVLMPLRMIYVSGANFPYNRLGYRYSWTMMLHNHSNGIIRHEPDGNPEQTVLLLSYLVPTCFRPNQPREDIFMPRSIYFGESSLHAMQDDRTIPLHLILTNREAAMLAVFPVHFLSLIAHGFAKIIDKNVGKDACLQQGMMQQARMGMHSVYFAKLNQKGPYSRLVDPTMDLVSTAEAQNELSPLATMWNALWDRRPAGHEFLLRRGIGSLRSKALRWESKLKSRYPQIRMEMIADRSACLRRRPLWFRPMANPYMVIPLIMPTNETYLSIRSMEPKPKELSEEEGVPPEPHWKEIHIFPGQTEFVHTIAMEISIDGEGMDQKEMTPCGDTVREDVLFAFLF